MKTKFVAIEVLYSDLSVSYCTIINIDKIIKLDADGEMLIEGNRTLFVKETSRQRLAEVLLNTGEI